VVARRRVAVEHPGRGYDELAAKVIRANGRDPSNCQMLWMRR
jgi:hypothetical protein